MDSTATFRLPAPGISAIREPIELVGEHRAGGPPTWLYLHGLGSVRTGEKSEALRTFTTARGEGFARFDLRGHGESGGALERATLFDLVADTAVVLEKTGPAVLFGSSLGGLVAAWTAAKHPEHVQALVLLAPAFGFLQRRAAQVDPTQLSTAGGEAVFTLSKTALDEMSDNPDETIADRLQVPTFIVHGSADETVDPARSRAVFDAISHNRKEYWLIDGGDHRLNVPVHAVLDRAAVFLAKHSK